MTMSAKPSIVSPSPWMTVAVRLGVQRPTSRAQFVLTTFGTTHEQRVGVGGLRGEQRLGGLAEARLVGEQEGAVAGSRRPRRAVPGAASASGRPARRVDAGLGQGHAGRRAAADATRTTGSSGPRSSQVASRLGSRLLLLGSGLEVGGEERVGELSGDDRLRHDLRFVGAARLVLGLFLLDGRLDAGRLAASRAGATWRSRRPRRPPRAARGARCRGRRSWPGSWRCRRVA